MNENIKPPPREPGVQYAHVRPLSNTPSPTHLSPLPLNTRKPTPVDKHTAKWTMSLSSRDAATAGSYCD